MPSNILTAIIAAREDWRNRLTTDYEATATRLQTAYARTLPRIQDQRDLLIGRLQELSQNDDALTVRRVRGLPEYQDLAARIQLEMDSFSAIAQNEAATLAESAVQMGLFSAEDMTAASAGQGRQLVMGMWNRPDPAALARLVNYVDSDAMRSKWTAFGTNAGQNFADTVLAGIAQGMNPNATARLISNWMNVPLAWAASSVRTVQLYSYRKAAHETYRQNSDILDGWVWIASLDNRCCLSCISQHGSKHGLDEELNDHFQGRCSPAPIVKGTTWADDIQSGQDWYNEQSPQMQRELAGNANYEALKSGKVQLADFVQSHHSDVYGSMLRQGSLRDVLNNPRGKVATPFGMIPRDSGTPGQDIDSLREFVFDSDGPLAKAILDDDMGLLEFNSTTGGYDINKTNVANAARQFVVESRDIQYGKDYILSLVREQAEQNGVNVNAIDAELMYNNHMSYRARAIQLTSEIGNVRLTDAQRARLARGANGEWLDMVYTTESSERGSLANATRRHRGGLNEQELRQARANFRDWVQGID